MQQGIRHRLHILEATDWKDGVITILAPTSPYLPWRYAFGDVRPGDYALLVLGTDPVSVLTVPARIGDDGGLDGLTRSTGRYDADVVDLTTLAMLLDIEDAFTSWRLEDDVAERIVLALHETPIHGRPHNRWGHSSFAAARNLLAFSGLCHGCGDRIDLSCVEARDNVYVYTADPLPRPDPPSPMRAAGDTDRQRPHMASMRELVCDWPAVLCRVCHSRMREGGFGSFVEFRFAQHPKCPHCGGGQTQRIQYGMPVNPDEWGPWLYMGGCCVGEQKWHCRYCEHRWN